MGDYGGYMGLFEFKKDKDKFIYNYNTCTFVSTKHIIGVFIALILNVLYLLILYSFKQCLTKSKID